MKHQIIATLLGLSCALTTVEAQKTTASTSQYPTTKYRDFVPIAPIEYYDNVEISTADGIMYKYIKTLTKPEMLKYLTNETVLVAVAEVDKSGNISYTPTRISKKGKQYIISMDYIKFATIDLKQDGETTGEACVGVGMRIVANISAKEDNVNLGDLFAVGMAVKNKQVYGSLRMEVIGMHDPEITSAIPLPSEISSATIQSMMQVMSTIKYKLYQANIDLSPQILGMRLVKDGVSLAELNETVMRYHDLGKKNATQSTKSTQVPVNVNSVEVPKAD